MGQYLMICCLWATLATCLAEFPRIQHLTKKSKRNGYPIEFLVVGDWGRGGLFNQSRVAKQMGVTGKKLEIDFIVSTGDNFYDNGLISENDPLFRRSFTNIYKAKSLQKPWYTVLGNHDYLGNTKVQVSGKLRKFDSRWNCKRNFVVETGMVDMFFIDTTPFVDAYFENPKKNNFDWKDILPRERYLSTVEQHLDLGLSKSRAPWKIVVGHHTIRSIGHHGDTQEIIDHILPILENVMTGQNEPTPRAQHTDIPMYSGSKGAHKVDMYINGHDHCLEHLSNSKGSPQFFTSGGGSKAWKNDIHHGSHDNFTHFYYDGQGFMSVKITYEKAKVVFYDVSGNPMYRLNLRPQPKTHHSKATDV